MKGLNTKCLDAVLFVSYRELVQKIQLKNQISESFPRTSKTMTPIIIVLNKENDSYMHLS